MDDRTEELRAKVLAQAMVQTDLVLTEREAEALVELHRELLRGLKRTQDVEGYLRGFLVGLVQ